MIAPTLRLPRASLFLAVLFLAGSAAVRADDLDYLPKNTNVLYHLDAVKILKSKAYQDLMKKIPTSDEAMAQLKGDFGVAPSDVARVTVGLNFEFKQICGVITTLKPVTAAAIKAARKPPTYQTNFAYQEMKVGAHTVYVETWQYASRKVVESGPAFCVMDGMHIVIGSRLDVLKSVLEPNRKDILSPVMQTALKDPLSTSAVGMLVDLQTLPADMQNVFVKNFAKRVPAILTAFPNTETLAVRVIEDDLVKVAAKLICKDEASAGEAKKACDSFLTGFQQSLKKQAGDAKPADVILNALVEIFNTAKLSTSGPAVNGTITMLPSSVLYLMPQGKKAPKN